MEKLTIGYLKFTCSLVLITLNVSVKRVCLASPEKKKKKKCSHSLGLTRGKERRIRERLLLTIWKFE